MAIANKILAHKDGRIGTLVFDNPVRHNAVTIAMWKAATSALEQFAKDDDVRVLVVAGAGDQAFVSGADISKFVSERATRNDIEHYNSTTQEFFSILVNFPKPSIAQIQGYCIGGGLNLAIGCDLRFCSDGSLFAYPAAKLGIGCAFTSLKRFIDVIGPANTMDILFSARQFGATEALSMGVVNCVLPKNELARFVGAYAERIAGNAPLTITAVKQAVIEAFKSDGERNLALIADLVARCGASKDYVEGRNAFMEKREPKFIGK